ncbi:hypothetical protein [Marinomonas balearica]|uniref:Uncharacterized protein n=1 Tax=Marinomonas balearica TaxID=491947 RepID=A0A4R6M734_9GAMM|nr:hypothetical protein [Marinomonas balearica]TDO97201.1 hypothetical protein DFP79_2013 [Marinomonas balearica]
MPRELIKNISELYDFFDAEQVRQIDAEFSHQTKQIIDSLGAKKAHLNKWWVMTPMDWKCPSCCRPKPDIAKLDHHNYASCHLHEHHDHMQDIVKDLFAQSSANRTDVIADNLSERFAIRTAFAISAYDNTVICADCNKADGDAKKLVGADRNFSFSPGEISEFIITTPNQEHKIDKDKGSEIWHQNKHTFEQRMELAKSIANLAANDTHWYKPSHMTAKQVKRQAKFWLSHLGLDELDTSQEAHKLLYDTTPFKGEASSWRTKNKPQSKASPSVGDALHLSKVRGHFWNKFDEDWICPCCGRNKFNSIQKSKSKSWVFEVKEIYSFNERSEEYCDIIQVCNECYKTSYHLGKEASSFVQSLDASFDFSRSYNQSLVSISEIKKIIQPRPHSSHLIDNSMADELVDLAINRITEQTYYHSPLYFERRERERESGFSKIEFFNNLMNNQ